MTLVQIEHLVPSDSRVVKNKGGRDDKDIGDCGNVRVDTEDSERSQLVDSELNEDQKCTQLRKKRTLANRGITTKIVKDAKINLATPENMQR